MNTQSIAEAHAMKMSDNGFPRRCRIDLYTPAETAIREAMLAVESAGAHPLLTDAVSLLEQAKNKVADFVELPTTDIRDDLIEALNAAINTAECDSIGRDGTELPWYRMAKAALLKANQGGQR